MKTLLIVDDNTTLSGMTHRIIETEIPECKVTCCQTIRELRQIQCAFQPYDVVLLDWMLPDGNGQELLVELKKLWPTTKYILMSANLEQVFSGKISIEGAALLPKPFDSNTLLKTLAAAMDPEAGHSNAASTSPNTLIAQQYQQDNRLSATNSDPRNQRHHSPSRHRIVNCLSRILSGIRAFEGDLRADIKIPALVEAHTDAYVDRLVNSVHELNRLIDQVDID